MSSSISRVKPGFGLLQSPRMSGPSMPLRSAEDVSWLPRCRVGDDQGPVGACAMFAMASWAEIMYERPISDAEVIKAYDAERKRLGQKSAGLYFPQAFEGAKAAGWLPRHNAIVEVFSLDRLSEQPILGGFIVTKAWHLCNGAGFIPDGMSMEVEGYHAETIVAYGEITGIEGGPFVYKEGSWGLQYGWNGITLVSESLFQRLCKEMWVIE